MHRTAKIIQAFTYWPIYLIFKFFTRFKVNGQENLKGLEDKAIIFASNHASYIDGPICAAAMPRYKCDFYPRHFFPIRFLAFAKYFKWRYLLVAFYVCVNGSIKIFRTGGNLEKSLSNVIKELNKGAKVWIYPEGGITKDGKLRLGKRGVAYLHQRTGVPVVPVGLNGTFKILSFKTLFFFNKIKVNIGKPIYFSKNVSLEDGIDAVMNEIAKLLKV